MIILCEQKKDLENPIAKAVLFFCIVIECPTQLVQSILIPKSIVAFINAFTLLRCVVAKYSGIENNQQKLADAEKIKRCMEIKYV